MRSRSIDRLISAILLFLACYVLQAQRFSFQRYGESQGLLDLVITDLIQDRDGYIWVATFNGVYRYDGTSFQRFDDLEGIPFGPSTYFLETPDGTFWIASDRSLSRREGSGFRKFELGVELLGPQPVAWLQKRGRFALATDEGLATVAVQDGGLGQVSFDAKARGQPSFAVYAAPDGSLWYSAGDGVCRRDQTQTHCFGPGEGVPKDRWTGIRMDRNRNLWIRSEKKIFRLTAGSARFEQGPNGLPPADGTGTLNLDRDGNLFVPTQRGLARLVNGGWHLVAMREGMTSNSVQVALEDREGSLWIGHLGAGLERWRGYDSWEGWTELEGLANSSILAIQPLTPDHLLLGTDRGLVEFRVGKGTVRTWLERDGLAGDHVFALAYDASGDLWIGSSPGGLCRMNHMTGHIDRIFSSSSEGVLNLAIDHDGAVWAGTDHRLLRFEPSGGGHFRLSVPPGSPVGYTPGIMLDRSGRLWAATSGNIFLCNRQLCNALGPVQDFSSGSAMNVAEDHNGATLVLSTSGRVYSLVEHAGQWSATTLPPLSAPNTVIPYFLRSDRSGVLWVGTDRGVFALEPNGKEWRWYTEDDGLVWNDVNVGAFHSGAGNDVWIGTSRGLAHYTPPHRKWVRPAPRAAIVSLEVNGRALEGSGPFTWNYPASSVQLHVTALTFTNEERNRFLYRLRGIDKTWMHTSSHEIVYSDLRPGTYTFEVLAQAPDGTVSNVSATAVLTVLPPWYLTRTFLALAVAAVLFLLITVYYWRTRSFVLRQRELEAAVADRTRELRAERRFERDQAQILEMIVSDSGLNEILDSIAEMVRTYPPGFDCSIVPGNAPVAPPRPGMTTGEISSTAGERIGWIYFAYAGGSGPDPVTKVVSVAKRLAAVAIETRGAYERLDHQANHDLLTGLPNRLYFQEGIKKAFQEAARDHQGFAVIYIDLDRFKEINDQHGHRMGDLFLQEISNRFRGCMRKGDLLARLGGDEFAAILPGADSAAAAERIVRALKASLESPVLLPGCAPQAYASIGYSLYPRDAADTESLLRAADQAMYRAKQKTKTIPHPTA
jgi:diguanylate cyclase (GGDEF)-like protein